MAELLTDLNGPVVQPEPEFQHRDGTMRKAHYGTEGEQPWDVMVRTGLAVSYATACVLKYLDENRRKMKGGDDDVQNARWYFTRLVQFQEHSYPFANKAIDKQWGNIYEVYAKASLESILGVELSLEKKKLLVTPPMRQRI